jgi:hypothetical protein
MAGDNGTVLHETGFDATAGSVTLTWQGTSDSQVLLDALWGAGTTVWAGGQDGLSGAPVLLSSQGGQAFQAQAPSFFNGMSGVINGADGVLASQALILGLTGTAAGELWVAAADTSPGTMTDLGLQAPHLFHLPSQQGTWAEWSLHDNGWPSQLYSPGAGTVFVTGDDHSMNQAGLALVTGAASSIVTTQIGADQIAGVWGAGQDQVWGAGGDYVPYRRFFDVDDGLIVYYHGTIPAAQQDAGTNKNLQTAGGADLGDVWIGGDGGTILRRRLQSTAGP